MYMRHRSPWLGLAVILMMGGCSESDTFTAQQSTPKNNHAGAAAPAVRMDAFSGGLPSTETPSDGPNAGGFAPSPGTPHIPPQGGALIEPIPDEDPPTPEPGGNPPAPDRGGSPSAPDPGGTPPAPDPGGSPPAPDPGGSPPAPDPGGSPPGPGGQPDDECDHMEVLARNSCQTAGCHATPVAAGLDLTRDDLHLTLLSAPSQSPGCNERLLIDPRRPERSLFLQAIGAVEAPGGDNDTCQVVMPPQGGMSRADRACLANWIRGIAADNRPDEVEQTETPVHSALTKLKLLVHGGPLTSDELTTVVNAQDERRAVKEVLASWMNTPEFETKMHQFLGVSLQQRFGLSQNTQFGRLRLHSSYRDRLRRVIEESFIRTAMGIINRGEPFNNIARTRTWVVTTANLALLAFTDQTQNERGRKHRLFSAQADAPRALTQQVRQRRWYIDHPEIGDCEVPQSEMLNVMLGNVRRRHCNDHQIERNDFRFSDGLLTEADFNDWREVRFTYRGNAPGDSRIPFYDVERLRQAEEVVTRIPRVGFFTTNAFFQNWPTNIDNQFRVTTNQSLITALHLSFSTSDRTEPIRDDGLNREHADQQACVGCHRHLDPMRLYFSKSYNVNYQRPYGNGDTRRLLAGLVPSFAFQGRQAENQDLRRFGEQLARHPRFGKAWAQKLCLYANSNRCDESDSEFVVSVDRFVDGGFNFKNLMIDLFSSHLVTGRKPRPDANIEAPNVSITRQQHMCALFEKRLNRAGICNVNRVRNVIGLIPKDDFARGVVDPTQPVRPSPIYFAAVESVCEAVARTVVGGGNRPFSTGRPQRTLERMVSRLMSLPTNHPRAEGVRLALTDHYEVALERGVSRADALRSSFTIACMSPDVVGVGL